MENINKRELVFTRTFNTPRLSVWMAWINPKMVAKWWGPKDFTAPSIRIDFRVGGKYLFCMRGAAVPGTPERDYWSTGTYEEIVLMKKIVHIDSFSDKDGKIIQPSEYGMNPNFPEISTVTVMFEDEGDKTKLSIIYKTETDAVYDAMLNSGMEQGWMQSLEKLARLVEK